MCKRTDGDMYDECHKEIVNSYCCVAQDDSNDDSCHQIRHMTLACCSSILPIPRPTTSWSHYSHTSGDWNGLDYRSHVPCREHSQAGIDPIWHKRHTRGMIKFSYNLVLVLVCLSLIISADALETALSSQILQHDLSRTPRSITQCSVSCVTARIRPVCASDHRTYASRCHVRRARRCMGKKNVRPRYRGKCTGKKRHGKKSACSVERKKSVARAHKPSVGVFIPKCNNDGSYAQVQCHAATGYCWCVDKMGMPTSSSRQMNRHKPNCGSGGAHQVMKAGKRVCTKFSRQQFNKNIIRAFEDEYDRMHPGGRPSADRREKQKRVVDWKFTELDGDNDNKLKKREMRDIRGSIKLIMKPLSCARTFVNYCDLDQDNKILRGEWALCLGVDVTSKDQDTNGQIPDFLKEQYNTGKPNPSIFGPSTFVGPIILTQVKPQVASTTESPTENFGELPYRAVGRCDVTRMRTMRDNQMNPASRVFVPTCTTLGLYQKEQCHQTKQMLCWCVEQTSGKPIKGTATHGAKPSCDIRHMKGCSHSFKRRFLTYLMSKLIRERHPKKDVNVKRDKSFYDEMVRWKFKQLDISGNRILERKEWKKFKRYARKVVRKRKSLRKCGRNFLRFCDIDSNRKISLAEWINCTGVERNLYTLPKRKGKNPLTRYLQQT